MSRDREEDLRGMILANKLLITALLAAIPDRETAREIVHAVHEQLRSASSHRTDVIDAALRQINSLAATLGDAPDFDTPNYRNVANS